MTAVYLIVINHATQLVVLLNVAVSVLDILVRRMSSITPDKRQSAILEIFEDIKSDLTLSIQLISFMSLLARQIWPQLMLSSIALLLVLLSVQFVILWLTAKRVYGSDPANFITVIIEVCIVMTVLEALPILPSAA